MEEIYKQLRPRLYSQAMLATKNKAESDDLVSEVFVVMLEKSDQINNPSQYAFGVLRNLLFQKYRSKYQITQEVMVGDVSELESDAQSPEDLSIDSETLRIIESELYKLDLPSREVIGLKIWQELTFGQISEITGETESAVKLRYYRAIEHLKVAMGERSDSKKLYAINIPFVLFALKELRNTNSFIKYNPVKNIRLSFVAKTLLLTIPPVVVTVAVASLLLSQNVINTTITSQPVISSPVISEPSCNNEAAEINSYGINYDNCFWKAGSTETSLTLTSRVSSAKLTFYSLGSIALSPNEAEIYTCSEREGGKIIKQAGRVESSSNFDALIRIRAKEAYEYASFFYNVVPNSDISTVIKSISNGYCINAKAGFSTRVTKSGGEVVATSGITYDSNDLYYNLKVVLAEAGQSDLAQADSVVESLAWNGSQESALKTFSDSALKIEFKYSAILGDTTVLTDEGGQKHIKFSNSLIKVYPSDLFGGPDLSSWKSPIKTEQVSSADGRKFALNNGRLQADNSGVISAVHEVKANTNQTDGDYIVVSVIYPDASQEALLVKEIKQIVASLKRL